MTLTLKDDAKKAPASAGAEAPAPKEPRRVVLADDMAIEIAGVSVQFKAGVPKVMWRSQRAILDTLDVSYSFKD